MDERGKYYLSVEEVAHELGVSQETVRRMVKASQLPSTRIRTLIRIPAWSLDELAGVPPQPREVE